MFVLLLFYVYILFDKRLYTFNQMKLLRSSKINKVKNILKIANVIVVEIKTITKY